MKITIMSRVRKFVINEEEDDDLFVTVLDNDAVPGSDDELEPNPIELNIPSSKEFDDEPDEDDIFELLLNILELLFFPKLKKKTKYKTITKANIPMITGFINNEFI
jgi:hypothetical protein